MPITTIPPALQVRPISAHWNAPNEVAAQTDKHVDREGGLSLPLVNRPHPHPSFFFLLFFSCPALCLFGSVHPRSLSWGTYQPEEEERRGGGGAGSSVSSSREERRGEKGGEREQTARSAGHQRDEGSLCFSSPPSVQSNSLIYCRLPNWRCEGGCWTGDAERTDAASRRWGAQWGRRRPRRFPSQLSRQRDSTKTHTPPSTLLPPPVILQKHLLCRRCGRLPPSLPPPSPQSHSEQLC